MMQAATSETIPQALLPSLNEAIKLPIFEGPLDLLLFLIRKNEIDIYDIPIETVTRQYLNVLYSMERLDLEVAGEFFVMASTLMYIKSRMLLPKAEQAGEEESTEEASDPRWELVEQLIQYKQFKEATLELQDIIAGKRTYVPRMCTEEKVEQLERPLKTVDKMEIWGVFNAILRRLADKMLHGEIHDEQVTVAEQMESVLERLKDEPSFMFSSLIPEEPSLNMIIATFLAVLELCRLKKVHLVQDEAFEDIHCTAWSEEKNVLDAGEMPL